MLKGPGGPVQPQTARCYSRCGQRQDLAVRLSLAPHHTGRAPTPADRGHGLLCLGTGLFCARPPSENSRICSSRLAVSCCCHPYQRP